MDHRLNNEALIACVVAQIVSKGACSVPKVAALIPMLLNDRFRDKVAHGKRLSDKDYYTIGMDYRELLVHVMNSIILLIDGKCIILDKGELRPLDRNRELCDSMGDSSKRLTSIINQIDAALDWFANDSMVNNYKKLYISL